MTAPRSTSRKRPRCIIIGAGVSGILIGYRLKQAFGQDLDFHIFEKNEDVGGTWLENRYPGCACDVPSHIYQYSDFPNPNWSHFHATSQEIQEYLKAVMFQTGVDKCLSLNSKVERAQWDQERNVWQVSIEGKGCFESEFLINAGGIFNNIAYPQIKGLDSFSGPKLHTAAWNTEVDLKGKRIAIIGAGASAVQCLPALQPEAAHIDIYIRTPSWIIPPAGSGTYREGNHKYTPDEINRFKEDMTFSIETRKKMESHYNGMYKAFIKGSPEQMELRAKYEAYMREKVPAPSLQEKIIPTFEAGCRRINPGESYLEALQQPNVEPIFDPIDEVCAEGIVAGGKIRQVDAIITATGFDTSFRPRFPIIGLDGQDLRELWKEDPVAYLGVAVSAFPNYLTFLGPNTPTSNGSLIGCIEATADFFVRLLQKTIREEVLSFNVRKDIQTDFDTHTQHIMKDLVWTGSCSSWYKSATGKVLALWPGSALHYRQVLDSNRWEAFEWKYQGNPFAHWGYGFSDIEQEPEGTRDLAFYIKPHDNLPQEAFDMAAKGYTQASGILPGPHFRPPN